MEGGGAKTPPPIFTINDDIYFCFPFPFMGLKIILNGGDLGSRPMPTDEKNNKRIQI